MHNLFPLSLKFCNNKKSQVTTILIQTYIRKKDIDEICAPYKQKNNSNTSIENNNNNKNENEKNVSSFKKLMNKAKMYTKMFAHIGK